MKKHISYSELKTWAECPYKRKLSYQDRVKEFTGKAFSIFHLRKNLKMPELKKMISLRA